MEDRHRRRSQKKKKKEGRRYRDTARGMRRLVERKLVDEQIPRGIYRHLSRHSPIGFFFYLLFLRLTILAISSPYILFFVREVHDDPPHRSSRILSSLHNLLRVYCEKPGSYVPNRQQCTRACSVWYIPGNTPPRYNAVELLSHQRRMEEERAGVALRRAFPGSSNGDFLHPVQLAAWQRSGVSQPLSCLSTLTPFCHPLQDPRRSVHYSVRLEKKKTNSMLLFWQTTSNAPCAVYVMQT